MASKYKWDSVSDIKPDGAWSGGDSLGHKIETMLTRFIQRVILWSVNFMSDRFVDIFDNMMKIMRPGMSRVTDPIIQRYIQDESIPGWMKSVLQDALKEEGESSWVIKLAVFYSTMIAGITGGLEPIRRLVSYHADTEARSYLPSPQELSHYRQVGQVGDEAYKRSMANLGVADPLIDVYKTMARRIPSLSELMAGKWRGVVSEEQFRELIRRQGYDQKDIDLYEELSNVIPPGQDLIRMLVREAFNDAVSSKFGYDEDKPQEIDGWFAKQGYNVDWVKRYWRAHWQLPSPMQAYEMLHRGLIDIADLDSLLKTSDYPAFWRDKLRDISYNVMTRVDVRRLLQAGIIDANKALDTYKKMGYTPEDAQLLTDFAVRGISNEEKDLTKTEILSLYEEGLTDRDSTSVLLVKMGYDQSEAEEILKLSDVSIAKKMRTDLINYTKEKFLAKKIDENEARGELTNIGLKTQSVERYIMNWQRATEIESALPSFADAKRWYMGGYITEEKLRSLLAQHRHTQEHIDLYVAEMNDALTQEAQNG